MSALHSILLKKQCRRKVKPRSCWQENERGSADDERLDFPWGCFVNWMRNILLNLSDVSHIN